MQELVICLRGKGGDNLISSLIDMTDEGAQRLLAIRAEEGEDSLSVRIAAAPG